MGTAEGQNCTQLGGDGQAWPRAEMMLDRGEPSSALRQTSSFPRLQAEISKEEEREGGKETNRRLSSPWGPVQTPGTSLLVLGMGPLLFFAFASRDQRWGPS